MLRRIRIAAVVALALAGVVFLASDLVCMYWLRSVVAAGNSGLLNTDAAALDHDLRQSLPIGTSRPAVEEALRGRHVHFSFEEASRTIYSAARDLKGSNPLIETGLSLQFHFDESLSLKEIDSKVIYTGP